MIASLNTKAYEHYRIWFEFGIFKYFYLFGCSCIENDIWRAATINSCRTLSVELMCRRGNLGTSVQFMTSLQTSGSSCSFRRTASCRLAAFAFSNWPFALAFRSHGQLCLEETRGSLLYQPGSMYLTSDWALKTCWCSYCSLAKKLNPIQLWCHLQCRGTPWISSYSVSNNLAAFLASYGRRACVVFVGLVQGRSRAPNQMTLSDHSTHTSLCPAIKFSNPYQWILDAKIAESGL